MMLALCAVAAALPAQRRILPASQPAPPPCVQVRIGHDEAGRWDCVNAAIKTEVGKTAPVSAADSPGERLAPIGRAWRCRRRRGSSSATSTASRSCRSDPNAFFPRRLCRGRRCAEMRARTATTLSHSTASPRRATPPPRPRRPRKGSRHDPQAPRR
ncbi:hypothetical protein FE772_11705 [Lysobacter enzymogenes]|nr:hypothetical protein FE772_11705 [Lysobacter enzymogenes]